MTRHLMAVMRNVEGEYATSRYALCGTYPADLFSKTISLSETTCKRCLVSRALTATVKDNTAAILDGKTIRNITHIVEED
jgi:hypothetical protein